MQQSCVAPDGAVLSFAVEGEGEPLLLIHGACVDSRFFDRAAALLSRTHRVITYDRRGYGESKVPEGAAFDMVTQAQDAALMIRACAGGRPCKVVAHSAGCCVALELAARFPERVSGLVLHEPVAIDCLAPGDPVHESISHALSLGDAGLTSLATYQLFALERVDESPGSTGVEAAHVDAYCRQFVTHEAREVYRAHPRYEALRGLPSVVGIGELSLDTYHARCCPELARRIGARLITFKGAHNLACDRPDEFAQQVLRALSYIDLASEEL